MIRKGHKGAYGRLVKGRPGRCKGGVPLRCNHCQKRDKCDRRPWRLAEWPRCSCGRRYAVDWYRFTGAETRANNCDCGAYGHPHRRGSLFCATGAAGLEGWSHLDDHDPEFLQWNAERREREMRGAEARRRNEPIPF